MYNTYYNLTAKPFQLNPDPDFYFASRGHNRAMAYLQYGLSREEGFIVITGEVGAGKTTLARSLCRRHEAQNIAIAHIVNTALDSADILRMVAAALDLSFENISKAALLLRLHMYMKECHGRGTRILLIVDEAQNLSRQALEELRMLSNLQVADKSMLQIFLLGQPEFRHTLMSDEMEQLRQRVIASYHLGPLDASESRAYIEHRLHTAGWRDHPTISDGAFQAIHDYTQGVPRRINTLCDRLFLMGYLEELKAFGTGEVNAVIADIQQEFPLSITRMPASVGKGGGISGGTSGGISEGTSSLMPAEPPAEGGIAQIEERVAGVELSITSLLGTIRKMISSPQFKNVSSKDRS